MFCTPDPIFAPRRPHSHRGFAVVAPLPAFLRRRKLFRDRGPLLQDYLLPRAPQPGHVSFQPVLSYTFTAHQCISVVCVCSDLHFKKRFCVFPILAWTQVQPTPDSGCASCHSLSLPRWRAGRWFSIVAAATQLRCSCPRLASWAQSLQGMTVGWMAGSEACQRSLLLVLPHGAPK